REEQGRVAQGGLADSRHCRLGPAIHVFREKVDARVKPAHDETTTAYLLDGLLIMPPKVLISDALSPAAVQIFKDRGLEVDFQPKLGGDKEKLAELVGGFDGLAIRSATKVTPKILEKAKRLRVIGRAGIGVDNVDVPAATAKGVIVMNTPFGNSITTAEH